MSKADNPIVYETAVALLDQHNPKFVEYAQARIANDLRSKFSASDVVQQTYLESLKELHHKQFQNREQFLAWFYQLLHNNLIDLCRGYRRSQKRDVSKEQRLTPNCGKSCSVVDILTLMVKSERFELLSGALELLPSHNRKLVRWRFVDGMSYAEIADITGRSEDSARMAVNRALEKLSLILGSHVSLST